LNLLIRRRRFSRGFRAGAQHRDLPRCFSPTAGCSRGRLTAVSGWRVFSPVRDVSRVGERRSGFAALPLTMPIRANTCFMRPMANAEYQDGTGHRRRALRRIFGRGSRGWWRNATL
jgi:hypothetical protein